MGSRAEVMAALHEWSGRFVDLVVSLTAADAERPVPGLDWNVGETAAHVLTVVRRGFADRRRSAAPTETAGLNQACLDELPERDPAALAELLRADVHTALDLVFPKVDDDREFPFHGGVTTTMTPALHIVLGEYVIHGFDVARAVGRPWPIDQATALLLVPNELLGAWLQPDAPDESYALHLGTAAAIRVEIRDRRLVIGAGEGDASITMPAEDFVLRFYGRVPNDDLNLFRLQTRFQPS